MAKLPNGQVRDITSMSDAEIAAYMQERKANQAKLVAEKGKEARKAVEKWLHENYGLTLAQVWMANQNAVGPKTYLNPATQQTYVYSGRGKVPEWLKGPNGKPNPLHEIKAS